MAKSSSSQASAPVEGAPQVPASGSSPAAPATAASPSVAASPAGGQRVVASSSVAGDPDRGGEEIEEKAPGKEVVFQDVRADDEGKAEEEVPTDAARYLSYELPAVQGAKSSWLTQSEYRKLSLSKLVPSSFPLPVPDNLDAVVPSAWTVPPEHPADSNLHLVGVPATMESIAGGAYTMPGFGGLQSMLTFETFSTLDLDDLESIIGPDVRQTLLLPRIRPLEDYERLEVAMGSVSMRREVASLLVEFEPNAFAERVFNTYSFLRRLLTRYRDIRDEMNATKDREILDAHVARREELETMRREWSAMCQCWDGIVHGLHQDLAIARSTFRQEFREQAESHQAELECAQKTVEALREELKAVKLQLAVSERRRRKEAPAANDIMSFLHEHATLTSNWERLRDLLDVFVKKETVPSDWITTVVVLAADQPAYVSPPYQAPAPPTDDAASGPDDDTRSDVVDLSGSQPPSGSSSPGKGSGASGKSRAKFSKQAGHGAQFQAPPSRFGTPLRPTNYEPRPVMCLNRSKPTKLTEAEACASLGESPIVWSKLRRDIQCVMRAGLSYDDALARLARDVPAHQFFYREDLTFMLARMIAGRRLNSTPWARFVPEVYYIQAETYLDRMRAKHLKLDRWPNLDEHVEEILEAEDVSAQSDDEQDEDFDYRGEAAKDAGDDEQEDLGVAEPPLTPPPTTSDDPASESTQEAPPSSPAASSSKWTPRSQRRRSREESATEDEGSGRKSKKPRVTGSKRKPTDLARTLYDELSVDELAVIEDVDPKVHSSFRFYGALMQFFGGKSARQTPGFPDYEPQRLDLEHVYARFDCAAYRQLLDARPWEAMWNDRIAVLFFHRRANLDFSILAAIRTYLDFMERHAQAWWEAAHWVSIETVDAEGHTIEENLDVYQERRSRNDSVSRQAKTLKDRLLRVPHFPKNLFYEPGLWVFPKRVCHWIHLDARITDSSGHAISLQRQLEILDEREPARIQWTGPLDDRELIAHVPSSVRKTLIPLVDRARNFLPQTSSERETQRRDQA